MSVHGTARFSVREEVRDAGLIRSRKPGEVPDRLMVGYWLQTMGDFEPIEYGGDLHQLIVGGTGGGKFTTALAPMLLGSSLENQTVVVVDPKGEIAKLAGPFFEIPFYPKRTVHLLDPWDQCKTGQTAVLNVLEHITTDNPNYVDDARALADAMIIPSGGENTHWDNAARNFLTAILLYVALSPKEKDNRDLLRVRDIVSLTWAMPKAYTGPKRPTLSALLFELLDSDLAGGAVKRGVSSLLNREDKERSGIISSIDRDTSWIDSPQMEKVLRGKSLDLTEAAQGGRKYFIVLPPDFFMTHRAWLRLMVTAFAKAFKRTLPDPKIPHWMRWRHIIIDEFANLGEMSFILNDIAVSRGFAVKYHLAIQDLSQLARVYDKGWESFINNSFQRFFAISDLFTADYVSRMLGAATVQSVGSNSGTSGGSSLSRSAGDSFNRSSNSGGMGMSGGSSSGTGENYSTNLSENSGWSQGQSFTPTQRPLLTPDEVRRLEPNAQLLFFRGMHPIECWRPKYWEIFKSRPTYSLKEIWSTIGRKPKNAAELQYFSDWRMLPLLKAPDPQPGAITKTTIPGRPMVVPPRPKRRYGFRIAMLLAAAIAGAAYWLWPRTPDFCSKRMSEAEYILNGCTRLQPPVAKAPEPTPTTGPLKQLVVEPQKSFKNYLRPSREPAPQQPPPQSVPQQQAAPTVREQSAAIAPEPQPAQRLPQQPTQPETKSLQALVKPAETTETCTDYQRIQYRVIGFKVKLCDRQFTGGAMLGPLQNTYAVRWADECGMYCRNTKGCDAISYDPRGDERHTCKLFGSGPSAILAPGWFSATRNQ
jgi:type IV secretion system protein VirD4